MTVSTLGVVWSRFYSDKIAWPEGAFHDDTLIAVDGRLDPELDLNAIPDHAQVEIRSGYVSFPDGKDADLGEHFMAWLLTQTTAMGAFEVPREKLEAVHAAILAAGGKVIGLDDKEKQ